MDVGKGANIYPGADFGWPDSEQGWAEELFRIRNFPEFDAVKANSPFVGRMVVAVRYRGAATYHGDIDSFLGLKGIEIDKASSIIKNAIRKVGMKAHNSDDYIVVFDSLDSAPEIFHIRESGK